VITLHGGGHVIGNRAMEFGQAGLFAHFLRDKRVAALNLRQRLTPDFPPETLIGDMVSVFHTLMNGYKFKPHKIALYGCSAGANLAVLTTRELISQGAFNKSTIF